MKTLAITLLLASAAVAHELPPGHGHPDHHNYLRIVTAHRPPGVDPSWLYRVEYLDTVTGQIIHGPVHQQGTNWAGWFNLLPKTSPLGPGQALEIRIAYVDSTGVPMGYLNAQPLQDETGTWISDGSPAHYDNVLTTSNQQYHPSEDQ